MRRDVVFLLLFASANADNGAQKSDSDVVSKMNYNTRVGKLFASYN